MLRCLALKEFSESNRHLPIEDFGKLNSACGNLQVMTEPVYYGVHKGLRKDQPSEPRAHCVHGHTGTREWLYLRPQALGRE